MTAAIEALADDPPEELGDGSSVVHILLGGEAPVTCPKPGSAMRVLLEEDGETVGTLQIKILQIAAGSKSEYLPEAYKPLFQDESLQRAAFVEAKRRMEENAAEKAKAEAAVEQNSSS